MLITAIEYQKRQMNTKKAWRVQAGKGQSQNIVALDGSSFSASELVEVLQYTLVGRKSRDFKSAEISFCDHSGEEWRVCKKQSSRELYRNGKLIKDGHFESSILAALLDLDATLDPDSSAGSIIQSKDVTWDDQNRMISQIADYDAHRAGDLRQMVQRKIQGLLKESEQIINAFTSDKKKTLVSLSGRIRPLFYSWNELNRQKKEIDLESEEEILKPEQIENFEKEIQLLKQIEKVSLTLVDPKESPAVINRKLQAIEVKLSELSREIEMGHTSLKLSARIHWSKVLECLTRVEAYKGLVAASESVLRDNDAIINPAIEQHISTINETIIKNTTIVSELESCLSTLTLHQRKKSEYENKKTTKKISKLMRNFVNAAPLDASYEEPSGIETARLAVDHALCKMGEIKTEVDVSLNVLTSSSDSLHVRHEKLVDKYGKLRTHWKEIAEKYRLPADLKISEALKLMTSHGKMRDLLSLREKYRKLMQEREEKLLEIRDLIENWRYLIGSQKDTPLANENILLSEANALMQLRPKKERQFERYKRDADRYKALSFLLQQLTERQMAIVEKWERAFENSGVRSHPIQDGNWLRIFERMDSVRALEGLFQNTQNVVKGQAIFNSDELEFPINVFSVQPKTHRQQIAFMNSVSSLRLDNTLIIVCPDSEAVQEMNKLGLSIYRDISPNPKPKKDTQKTPSPKKVISDKQIEDLISPSEQKPKTASKERVDDLMKMFQGI